MYAMTTLTSTCGRVDLLCGFELTKLLQNNFIYNKNNKI